MLQITVFQNYMYISCSRTPAICFVKSQQQIRLYSGFLACHLVVGTNWLFSFVKRRRKRDKWGKKPMKETKTALKPVSYIIDDNIWNFVCLMIIGYLDVDDSHFSADIFILIYLKNIIWRTYHICHFFVVSYFRSRKILNLFELNHSKDRPFDVIKTLIEFEMKFHLKSIKKKLSSHSKWFWSDSCSGRDKNSCIVW